MILDDNQALQILEASKKVPAFIAQSRLESTELFALIEGDDFDKELIEKIEHIESNEKQQARKKYSRDIAHFFTRLLRPVDNVYSATGGSKMYDIDNEKNLSSLLKKVGRVRSGQSLQEWLKVNWMPLYHADPNGVIFLEYKTKPDKCWPTYKNIDFIRNYDARGQMVEWILFEPKDVVINNVVQRWWRLVDDTTERWYLEGNGSFTLSEEKTFEHPFGQVPALINSDIEKLKSTHRISPIDKVLELSKEYARDQSIKTIYKFQNGFPIHWRYVTQCAECQGAKKNEDGNDCIKCDGHGYYRSKDVTDMVQLTAPTNDEVKLTPDIAGFISPDLATWDQYTEELISLEEMAFRTHWGTISNAQQDVKRTATEIIINSQPMIDVLNNYADVAEMMEGRLTEWIANFLDPAKDKDQKIASINYGRRYIIDPPDAILGKYETSKKEGDNNVILDRLLNEYFTAKYKNDPEHLRVILLKSSIEPYIHLTLEQVNTIFGRVEAQRKVLFEQWWNTLDIKSTKQTTETLRIAFDKWFEDNKPEQMTAPTPNPAIE